MGPWGRLIALLCAWAAVGAAVMPLSAAGGPEDRTRLGRPGFLIVTGVRDSADGRVFQPQAGPGPGRHALVWPEGTLSLPDSMRLEPFGRADVGVACGPELSGVGNGGRLVFRDGAFPVTEPLALSDGVVEMHVSAGVLEIRGDQLRYRRPDPAKRQDRANMIFLAGLVLLIVILMRRVRLRARGR
jgi:hypothetical protein